MTLGRFSELNPDAQVWVFFANCQGRAALKMPASKAANPCKSGRYFPPEGLLAHQLGWPVPYWYAHEVIDWKPA